MIEVVRSNEDLWIPIQIKQIQQRESAYNCARSGVPEPISYQDSKSKRWEKRRFVMFELYGKLLITIIIGNKVDVLNCRKFSAAGPALLESISCKIVLVELD